MNYRNKIMEGLKIWANKNDRTDTKKVLGALEIITEATRVKVEAYTAIHFADVKWTFRTVDGAAFNNINDVLDRAHQINDGQIDEYYWGLDALHAENGFDVPTGHCPFLVAADTLLGARKAIVADIGCICGVNFGALPWKESEKVLALALKYLP